MQIIHLSNLLLVIAVSPVSVASWEFTVKQIFDQILNYVLPHSSISKVLGTMLFLPKTLSIPDAFREMPNFYPISCNVPCVNLP